MSLISSNVCRCYYLLFYSFFFCAVLVHLSVVLFLCFSSSIAWHQYSGCCRNPASPRRVYSGISCLSPVQKALVCLGRDRLGFRVGWEHDRVSLGFRTSNMRSASDHADVVDAYPFIRVSGPALGRPVYKPSGSTTSCQPLSCYPKESPTWQVAPYPRSSAVRPLVLCFCTSLVRLCHCALLMPGSNLFSRLSLSLLMRRLRSLWRVSCTIYVILGRWSSDCRVKRNGEGLADV